MCEGIKNLKQFAADHKITINGIDEMPELIVMPYEFENPFDPSDDGLYVDETKFISYAKTADGVLHPLAMVSEQYELLQHYDALHMALERVVKDVPEMGTPKVFAGFNENGGRMFSNLQFPKQFDIQKDDPIFVRTTVVNSGDASRRYWMSLEAWRKVCANGMMAPDRRWPHRMKVKQLHKGGSLDTTEALDSMVESLVNYSEAVDLWKAYADIQIGQESYTGVLDASGFSAKMIENVIQQPLRGFDRALESDFIGNGKVNGWKAYNAATQFITDNVDNQLTAIDRGTKLSVKFDNLVLAKAA